MKKAILKVFGAAVLAAGMMYNVQAFDSTNGSDISLAALGNMAVAQSEEGDGFQKVSKSELDNGTVVIVCEGVDSLPCR